MSYYTDLNYFTKTYIDFNRDMLRLLTFPELSVH